MMHRGDVLRDELWEYELRILRYWGWRWVRLRSQHSEFMKHKTRERISNLIFGSGNVLSSYNKLI